MNPSESLTIGFAIPVYKRFELTAITFHTIDWLATQLEEFGYSTEIVIVGDDLNVDRAAEMKFHTIRQNNKWLGRKFSDGIEACYDLGCDFVVPMGSDNWVHPFYFHGLTKQSPFRSGNNYTVISPDAKERMNCWIVYDSIESAVGPYVIPRHLLKKNPRPCPDERERGCDSGTIAGLKLYNMLDKLDIEFHNYHTAQYVTFRTDWEKGEEQITPYARIKKYWGKNVIYTEDIFGPVSELFPAYLVTAVERLYAGKQQDLTN